MILLKSMKALMIFSDQFSNKLAIPPHSFFKQTVHLNISSLLV